MRNGSGRSIVISTLLGVSLLLLSCTPLPAKEKPLGRKVLRVTVEVYADPAEINRRCDPFDKDPRDIAGCHMKLGPDTSRLILPVPENWCDWNSMRTWGHELMHAFGFMHSKQYTVYVGDTGWAGKDCDYTGEYK